MTLRIAVTGAAGLVGQNLIPRLKARGFTDIVAIDKHPANTAILRRLHPDIRVIEADLAVDDGWQDAVAGMRRRRRLARPDRRARREGVRRQTT